MAPERASRSPALGPRGEGWVILQSALIVALAFASALGAPWPAAARTTLRLVSIAPAVAGAALFAGGIRRLGRALTPLPRPVTHGALREDGVYALVRHPIYGGILLLGLAWACWTSPLTLVPLAGLAIVFEGKRRREEAWLCEVYPAYPAYRGRVTRRFIPFVW